MRDERIGRIIAISKELAGMVKDMPEDKHALIAATYFLGKIGTTEDRGEQQPTVKHSGMFHTCPVCQADERIAKQAETEVRCEYCGAQKLKGQVCACQTDAGFAKAQRQAIATSSGGVINKISVDTPVGTLTCEVSSDPVYPELVIYWGGRQIALIGPSGPVSQDILVRVWQGSDAVDPTVTAVLEVGHGEDVVNA